MYRISQPKEKRKQHKVFLKKTKEGNTLEQKSPYSEWSP